MMSMKSKHIVNHPSTQACRKNVAELISGLILLLFNVVSSKPFIIFMATTNPFYYVLFFMSSPRERLFHSFMKP